MPREIPPVPITSYSAYRPKVGDGNSVEVTVPPGSPPIQPGQLCFFDGILGFAMPKSGEGLPSDPVNPQQLVLNIEQALYETDQINPAEPFDARGPVFWDGANQVLTQQPKPVFAGIITKPKDQNGVIEFLLAAQGIPGIVP